MKPLSAPVLALLALGGLIGGAALSFVMIRLAYSPPIITPWLSLLFVLIAVGLFIGGRGVKKLRRRLPTRVTAVDAARIALFARSAALNGALFAGFFGGILAVSLFRTWAPATLSAAWGAGLALAGTTLMLVVAWVVERWCIDDSDGPSGSRSGREGRGSGNRREGPSPAAYTESHRGG